MRKILLVAIVALGMLFAAQPMAAAAPGGATTFYTLQADDRFSQEGSVARLWSNGTDASVQVGMCAGDTRCIVAVVVDLPCGAGYAGCAYWSGDRCVVEVSERAMAGSNALEFNVLGHEVGHCVITTSYHPSNPRSIMYASISYGDNKKRLTAEDKIVAQSFN